MRISWIHLIAMLAASQLQAQGWIEPPQNVMNFAVHREQSVISVTVEGRLARIEVEEWFRNDGPRMAEGTYFYPLSGEASFQSFSLFQGDQELRGETMDANQARAIYEEIVRTRRDPALIELAGNGLIRARVFPINPGERRKITLRYSQLLTREGDAMLFRYLATRASGPLAGGSQSVIDRDSRVSFTLRAPAELYSNPFSPTHGITTDRSGDQLVVRTDRSLDGNMSLFLPLASETVGISMVTHRPAGEDGYFMLTLSPGERSGESVPRDVTVVLDVSGSMSGAKISQARAAIHQVLGTLSTQDRFRLIAFSNSVRQQSGQYLNVAPRNLRRAADWIDGLTADGGTNINDALIEAFRIDSPDSRLPIVLFLTDGLPTVGVQNVADISRNIADERGAARVFSFGVGYDVNTDLLDEMGTTGRGSTHYVEPGEDIEMVVGAIARKISHPVLGDLAITAAPGELFEIYPATLPDLFSGEELIVFGRFRGTGTGQLTIEGSRNSRVEEFASQVRLPRESSSNGFIPRLWAARKLGWMAGQLRQNPGNSELREEIRTLALRHGLLSEFTSYLVQEPEAQFATAPVDATAPPPARPMSIRAERARANGFRGAGSASGAAAVQSSANQGAMREARSLMDLDAAEESFDDKREGNSIRRVFGRIFQLNGEMWEDVDRKQDNPVITIEPFSSAYFLLLRIGPEYANILGEFEQVTLGGERINLEIREGGITDMDQAAVERLVRRLRGR